MPTVGDLIHLPKRLEPTALPVRSSRQASRNVVVRVLADCEGALTVRARVNENLSEIYSFVLGYALKGRKPVVLVRMNGKHGLHRNPDGKILPSKPHIHFPSDEELQLPVAAIDWINGPPWAIELDDRHLALSVGWATFTQYARLPHCTESQRWVSRLGQEDWL